MDAPDSDHRSLWFLNTRVSVRASSRDVSDSISVLEHMAPFGDSPPLHVHHFEDEVFHILEGEVSFQLGDTLHRTRAGDTILAPKRVPHSYRVVSPNGARMLTITRGEFESFIRAFGRPAESEGLPAPSGPPSPEQADALAQACRTFGIELVGPPMA